MSVKHAAITEVDKGAKKANVAAKYGITRWLLGDWIRNRVDIFKAVHSGWVDAKREAPVHFPKTEAAVVRWLHTSRGGGAVGISGPVLLCQALELNKAFPDESDFIGCLNQRWNFPWQVEKVKKRGQMDHAKKRPIKRYMDQR